MTTRNNSRKVLPSKNRLLDDIFAVALDFFNININKRRSHVETVCVVLRVLDRAPRPQLPYTRKTRKAISPGLLQCCPLSREFSTRAEPRLSPYRTVNMILFMLRIPLQRFIALLALRLSDLIILMVVIDYLFAATGTPISIATFSTGQLQERCRRAKSRHLSCRTREQLMPQSFYPRLPNPVG
jgi:hypothetical protein